MAKSTEKIQPRVSLPHSEESVPLSLNPKEKKPGHSPASLANQELLLANACLTEGKFSQARGIYSQLISHSPRQRELRFLRAEATQGYLEGLKSSEGKTLGTQDESLQDATAELLADRAMLLALDQRRESQDLENLFSEIRNNPSQDPETQKALLEKLALGATGYLQLAGLEQADPKDTEFVNETLCQLAAKTYGNMAELAKTSQDPMLRKHSQLYKGFQQLAGGDLEEARISLREVAETIPEAKERLEFLDKLKLRQLNLSALQVWRTFCEEKSFVLSGQHRTPVGNLLLFAEKLFRSDGRTSEDDLAINHSQEKKLILEVQRVMLTGDVNTIFEALCILSVDGPEELRPRARELMEQSRPSAKKIQSSLDLIPRLIDYCSQNIFEEDPALELLKKAEELQDENIEQGSVQSSLGIYAILHETSENRRVREFTRNQLDQSDIDKNFSDYLLAYLKATSPESLALEFALMSGAVAVAGVSKLATLEKFRIGAQISLKGRALAHGGSALAGGTTLWALHTGKDVLTHDPGQVLKPDHLARAWGASVIMFGGLQLAGDFSAWLGPKLARRLSWVKAGTEELNWKGKALTFGLNHTTGLGTLVGVNQANEKLKLTDPAKGKWKESLARDLVTYFEFSLARAFVSPYLKRTVEAPPSQAEIEARRQSLIREAQEALVQWKENPRAPLELDRFFLEVQTTLGKEPLNSAQREKVFRLWDRRFHSFQKKLWPDSWWLPGRDLIRRLENSLYWNYLYRYSASSPRMLDYLAEGKGNCVARCEMELATWYKARSRLSKEEWFAMEVYRDHIEAAIYNTTTSEIWRPGQGTQDQNIPVSLYHPALFYHTFLRRQGAPSPVSEGELLFLERNPPYRPVEYVHKNHGDKFYDFPNSPYALDPHGMSRFAHFSLPPSLLRILNKIFPQNRETGQKWIPWGMGTAALGLGIFLTPDQTLPNFKNVALSEAGEEKKSKLIFSIVPFELADLGLLPPVMSGAEAMQFERIKLNGSEKDFLLRFGFVNHVYHKAGGFSTIIFKSSRDKEEYAALVDKEEKLKFLFRVFDDSLRKDLEYREVMDFLAAPTKKIKALSKEDLQKTIRSLSRLRVQFDETSNYFRDWGFVPSPIKNYETDLTFLKKNSFMVNEFFAHWDKWQEWTVRHPDQFLLFLNELPPEKHYFALTMELTENSTPIHDLFVKGVQITGIKTEETPFEPWMEPRLPEKEFVEVYLVTSDYLPEKTLKEKDAEKTPIEGAKDKIAKESPKEKKDPPILDKKEAKKKEEGFVTEKSEIKISPETALWLFFWWQFGEEVPKTLSFKNWNAEISRRFREMNRSGSYDYAFLQNLEPFLRKSNPKFTIFPPFYPRPINWKLIRDLTPAHMHPFLNDMERRDRANPFPGPKKSSPWDTPDTKKPHPPPPPPPPTESPPYLTLEEEEARRKNRRSIFTPQGQTTPKL